MEEVKEILEGPEKFEDLGLASRLTYNPEEDSYRVEYSPLLRDGEIDGDWFIFGGSVGYNDTVYEAEEDAQRFYDDLENLDNAEVLEKLSVGEQK